MEFACLGELCSAIGWLPTSVVVSEGLEICAEAPFGSGGFAEIWRGRLKEAEGDSNGRLVAIKAFRIYPTEGLKEIKEVSKWRLPVTFAHE
jgi:hypothetical protein